MVRASVNTLELSVTAAAGTACARKTTFVPRPRVNASTIAVIRRRSRSQPSARTASGSAVPSSAGVAKSVSLAAPFAATARSESAPMVRMPAASELLLAVRLRLGISQGMRRARWKRSNLSVTTPDLGVRTQPPSFFSLIAFIEA